MTVNPILLQKKYSRVIEYFARQEGLSLCASLTERDLRVESAFFEFVRVLVTRLMNQGEGKKISLPEMNTYLNGMLTNEQVIEELLNLAKQIAFAHREGDQLGLTADTLRKNRTIDWQKRDSARARMRMMIKRLLKKHRYPPEGMDDAVQTVMTQCELWTDNNDMELSQKSSNVYTYSLKPELSKVAEAPVPYGKQ